MTRFFTKIGKDGEVVTRYPSLVTIYIICLALLFLPVGCGHRHDHAGHDHSHENCDHDHDHDHSHADHEHNHDHGEVPDSHDHDHSPDEIVILPEQAREAGIRTDRVQVNPFRMSIRTSGQILAAQGDEVAMVAPVNGIVSFARPVAEGITVKQGESLLTVSSRNMVEGDPVLKARLAFETAEKEYLRTRSLLADSLVSQREYEQAFLNYETAKVGYEALAGKQTAKGTNVAPGINGYVKNLLVSEGEYVTAGQPLATITQNRRLQLRADVPERYYGQLPHLISAHFTTPYDKTLYKLSDLKGRLLSYGRSTDATSFYVPVTFEFDNVGNLIQGAFVEVYLLTSYYRDIITLPLPAVIEEQGLYFIYVKISEDAYKKREIRIGEDNGEEVSILAGLEPGEQVVTDGTIHVKLASNTSAIPEHSHSH